MVRNALSDLLVLVLAAGCGSLAETTAAPLEPLPTTLLPVSPYRAAITAADGAANYRMMAEAGFMRGDATNWFLVDYSYFFTPVDNSASPVGLHDYLQHPDRARGRLMFAQDSVRGTVGGRYNVAPAAPLEASLTFGDQYFEFIFRGGYYFKPELEIGLQLTAGEINNNNFTNVYIFGGYAWSLAADSALAIELGVRINEGAAADGVYMEGEYYFDRYLSCGLLFSTDVEEAIAATGAYRFANGLGVNLEIGSKYDDFYLLLGGEYRF